MQMSEKKSHSLATMKTWIVLLRGVNFGGKNRMPMKALGEELEKLALAHRFETCSTSGENSWCGRHGEKLAHR
jgi:uncharacterized protein (DUF1697 family)